MTATVTPLRRTDERSIQEQFEDFHKANPNVYRVLVMLARQWVRRRPGAKLGIGMLWERARWELQVPTTGSAFRLNNDFRSRYARLIAQQEPDLAGIFETRQLRAA